MQRGVKMRPVSQERQPTALLLREAGGNQCRSGRRGDAGRARPPDREPRANFFLVRGGALYIPVGGILEGITREREFEIAAELGIPATERNMTRYDRYVADEAFLSSIAGGIIPVVLADGRRIGSGSPGSLTRRINDGYWERCFAGPDIALVVP